MARQSNLNKPWRLIIPEDLYAKLKAHLFPGDGDEHGAVILAGVAETGTDMRLLARNLHLAKDGLDYVPGERGYRMLDTEFIQGRALEARDEQLAYLAIHNHSGADQVSFSDVDLRSHKRGYPALLDITRGGPVGALVFAENAVAGDIWTAGQNRHPLSDAIIVGRKRKVLHPKPVKQCSHMDPAYDRQTRLFGDKGQRILSQSKIAIVGLGGAGSLIAEFLGRLGVGNFILVDPDKVEVSNLPRLVGTSGWDAMKLLAADRRPKRLEAIAHRFSKHKVNVAKRNIRRANPNAAVSVFKTKLNDPEVVKRIKNCDYIFLAADTMRARLLFNAIVHQYLIPGCQVGAKVSSAPDGKIHDVFAVARPVTPESGCLSCNQLINSVLLQQESITAEERRAQAYVADVNVIAPSVITLNALATAQAVNDFLFYMTGLTEDYVHMDYIRFQPTKRKISYDTASLSQDCIICSQTSKSSFARGDRRTLPTVNFEDKFQADSFEMGTTNIPTKH